MLRTMGSKRRSVLIVEDDVQASASLRRLLEHYGCEVKEAGTVAEGIEGLAGAPEFVFLDLELPDGDGTRVLGRVRMGGMASRVIVVSAVKERGALWRTEALHPEAMLEKPLDFMRV